MELSIRVFKVIFSLVIVSGILLLPVLGPAAEFKYDKGPVFMAEYDDEMKTAPLDEKAMATGMVFFAMKEGWVEGFIVNVRDGKGITLDAVANKHLEEIKKDKNNSEVVLVSSEKAETIDGSPAVQTMIKYVVSSYPATRLFFDSIKGGKWIFIGMWTFGDPEDIIDYLTSLEFE